MLVRNGIRAIRPGFGWFLIAMSALGAALVALCIRLYGPGLSPDSVGYISIARNLASSGTYRNYSGGVAPEWPPLYPVLAAILQKLTGIDALITAGLINVLSHGLTVYASGQLLSRVARHSPLAKYLGTVAIAISPALLAVSVMAWTEPLFICCTVMFLLALHDIVAGESSARLLVRLTLFAALAALTRYIGVVLIPVGVFIVLFFYAARPLKRLVISALLSLGALVPLGAWVWRNHRLTGTLMGSRSPSIFTLSDNLGFTLDTIKAWFLPEKVVAARYGLVIAVGLLGFLLWAFIRRRLDPPEARAAYALPPFLLMLAYLTFLIVSSTTTAYDQISNRLVVPIYVPVVVLLMMGWDLLSARWAGRAGTILVACALAGAFLPWFLYMKDGTTRTVRTCTERGAGGYNTRYWRESALVAHLRTAGALANERIYTNGPDVLYMLTPFETGIFSPRKGSYNSPVTVAGKPKMQLPARLIWFNGIRRAYLYTVEELRQYYYLTPVFQASDGAIYIVNDKS